MVAAAALSASAIEGVFNRCCISSSSSSRNNGNFKLHRSCRDDNIWYISSGKLISPLYDSETSNGYIYSVDGATRAIDMAITMLKDLQFRRGLTDSKPQAATSSSAAGAQYFSCSSGSSYYDTSFKYSK